MRGLGGFVLLAGLGVGLFYYLPAPVDNSTNLEQARRTIEQRKIAQHERAQLRKRLEAAEPPASRLNHFAARVPLAAPGKQAVALTSGHDAAPALKTAASVEPMPVWKTTVEGEATVAGPAGSLEPLDPDSRYQLVTDIQRELKRVGCYWGRVNGAWNNSTRGAMRTFNDRMNSALPIDQPDYLLLSTLKSYNGTDCGETVRPASTVAAATEQLPWTAQNQQVEPLFKPVPTSVVTTEPLPGRMAIGGPAALPAATQAPLIPGDGGYQGNRNATAALEPPAYTPPAASNPKPRTSKKSSKSRRASPGTPRYNLMLSLGGVY
jgi:hypothetical protein